MFKIIPSPAGYERASRNRMAGSDDEVWKTRSRNPRPVEGSSEIDVILGNGALERADGRTPTFWMIVRDDRPQRSYGRLLHGYREQPDALAAALPHRDEEVVRRVVGNLALLFWRDVVAGMSTVLPSDDEVIASTKTELAMRCVPPA